MNETPTSSHKPILSVTDVSWAVTGATRVTLTIKGKTSTPNWTDFLLVPSVSHPSQDAHFHFDAWGLPPGGIVPQLITDVSFLHSAPAGIYDVTVHSGTDSTTTHVNYPLGDGGG